MAPAIINLYTKSPSELIRNMVECCGMFQEPLRHARSAGSFCRPCDDADFDSDSSEEDKFGLIWS